MTLRFMFSRENTPGQTAGRATAHWPIGRGLAWGGIGRSGWAAVALPALRLFQFAGATHRPGDAGLLFAERDHVGTVCQWDQPAGQLDRPRGPSFHSFPLFRVEHTLLNTPARVRLFYQARWQNYVRFWATLRLGIDAGGNRLYTVPSVSI